MTPRSEMGAPSPATLRMRKSRERRRQGDVIVKLEIGSNMTADLVALGWLDAPDRVHKGALAPALVGLIDRAIAMRVTPSTIESESVCFTPLHVTAGPIAIGSDENAPQSQRLATHGELDGPHGLGLRHVQPGEVLGAAEGVAEIVVDKPRRGNLATGLIAHRRSSHPSPTWPPSTPSSCAPNRPGLSLGPSRLSRSRSIRCTSGVHGCLCGWAAGYGRPDGGRGRRSLILAWVAWGEGLMGPEGCTEGTAVEQCPAAWFPRIARPLHQAPFLVHLAPAKRVATWQAR